MKNEETYEDGHIHALKIPAVGPLWRVAGSGQRPCEYIKEYTMAAHARSDVGSLGNHLRRSIALAPLVAKDVHESSTKLDTWDRPVHYGSLKRTRTPQELFKMPIKHSQLGCERNNHEEKTNGNLH